VYRTAGPSRAAALGAVATLVRSIGPIGLRTPHTGATVYADGQPKLLQPWDGGQALIDWENAAHSLQGVCGTIGALDLQQHARHLVQRLRESAPVAETAAAASALHGELCTFVSQLRNMLEDGAPTQATVAAP
jgi:HPt (histidine-containing phosphotransfer) domain-containing protein